MQEELQASGVQVFYIEIGQDSNCSGIYNSHLFSMFSRKGMVNSETCGM